MGMGGGQGQGQGSGYGQGSAITGGQSGQGYGQGGQGGQGQSMTDKAASYIPGADRTQVSHIARLASAHAAADTLCAGPIGYRFMLNNRLELSAYLWFAAAVQQRMVSLTPYHLYKQLSKLWFDICRH